MNNKTQKIKGCLVLPFKNLPISELPKKKKIKNRNSKNDSKLTVINGHTKNKNESKLGNQLEPEGCH